PGGRLVRADRAGDRRTRHLRRPQHADDRHRHLQPGTGHQRQHLPGADREVRRHPAAGDVLRWADRGRSGRAGGEGMMDVQAQTGGAAPPESVFLATAGVRSAAPLVAAADAPEAADSAALSPAEWQFASAQRAGLYAWFSRLYAYEVSEHMYRSHFSDGG